MASIDEQAVLAEFRELRASKGSPLAQSRLCVKSDVYIDPQYFEIEKEGLHLCRPVIAATTGMVPAPGHAIDVSLGGVPIALVRDESGSVQAYINQCRHRGSPLVSGPSEIGKVLRCPYHSWSYKLDGALKSCGGDCGGFDGIDPKQYSLLRVPVHESHGLIWVQPKAAIGWKDSDIVWPDVTGFVANELESLNLTGHSIFKRRRDRFKANWKLILDTFSETYHISGLHRDSIHPIYYSYPNLYAEQEHISRIVTFKRRLGEIAEDEPVDVMRNTIWSYFGPNAVLTHPVDHFELWQVEPIGVDECEVTLTMLIKEDDRPTKQQEAQWNRSWELVCSVVHVEDFNNQENIQNGLNQGLMDRLIFGRNEPGLIHFHTGNLNKLGLLAQMTLPE